MSTKAVGGVLLLWLVAALASGVSGATSNLPLTGLVPILGSITTVVLLGIYVVRPMRSSMRAVPLGYLIACHVTRIGAGWFVLREYDAGRLPQAFAIIAGWGDIIVGIAALLILPIATESESWRRGAVFGWNLAGLAHILLVLSTGSRLGSAVPASMAAMTTFPLSLLPTFLVPLILVTHFLIFWRLFTAKPVVPNEADGEWTVIE